MAILFIENGYLFMKNFSIVSYQTSSQALTAILNVATNMQCCLQCIISQLWHTNFHGK